MSWNDSLTTAHILAVFTEEIAAHEGVVTDTFDDGVRLFTRSVLPRVEEVRPRDQLQGGVALRACGGEVWLHPYVFRLVCRNGAIMARAMQTRQLTDLGLYEAEQATEMLREAIRACCAEEAFTTATQEIRSARDTEADLGLNLLPLLSRTSRREASRLLAAIMDLFVGEGDRSRFGLMNAVTAVARDTHDPELRWGLEELGGEIAAGVPGPFPKIPAANAAPRRRSEAAESSVRAVGGRG
jgi:hypothetical protein